VSVLQYDVVAEYRPWCLHNHQDLQKYTFIPPVLTVWDRFWDTVWIATNFARERIRDLARNVFDLWNRAITRMRAE